MNGWNTSFLLGRPIFRGELLVSGSVVKLFEGKMKSSAALCCSCQHGKHWMEVILDV